MLLDGNIIIYASQPEHAFLRELIAEWAPSVSIVSIVEVLGFHRLTDEERARLEEFFAAAPVLAITDAIVWRAVGLRQQRRMSLGDALIAATALEHDEELVTRNAADFRWVDGLRVHDPFEGRDAG